MRHSLATALVLLLLLFGCGDRHLTRAVSESEIDGTWKLTQTSWETVKRHNFYVPPSAPCTISFQPSGRLDFKSLLETIGGSAPQFFDCTGNWSLTHNVAIDNSTPRANAVLVQLRIGPHGLYTFTFSLAEDSGKLHLWTYLGDPDSCESLEYERM